MVVYLQKPQKQALILNGFTIQEEQIGGLTGLFQNNCTVACLGLHRAKRYNEKDRNNSKDYQKEHFCNPPLLFILSDTARIVYSSTQ
jgi:hypothetical protein